MSASREKKQRQGISTGVGLTEKQRKEAEAARISHRHAVIYTIIGVIAAILVIALLVWNSGIFQRNATAATVGDQKFTVSELDYYYHNVKSMYDYYAKMGVSTGYSSDTSPADQIYDADSGKTFQDYFRESALDSLKNTTLLCSEAEKAGYTLSDDGKTSVDSQISKLKTTATQYGYTTKAYIRAVYGSTMTESLLKDLLTKATLASEYTTYYKEQQSFTDDDIEAYYKENQDTLDTFSFRSAYIDGSAQSSTDSDGNATTPTDEETTAAMDAAKTKAQELLARIKKGEDFQTAAADYVSDSTASSYSSDPDASLTTEVGSSLSSAAYSKWVTSSDRTAGDMDIVESSNGYYVMKFLKRYRDETPTVDIRHILVKAEVSDGADTPTDEQMEAAKTKIDSIKNEFESGDKTAESFGTLAEQYSEDTGSSSEGGEYTGVTKGKMFSDFDTWIFDSSRQPGDLTEIKNTQSGQQGWHLVYFEGTDAPVWHSSALTSLKSKAYSDWYSSMEPNYEATAVESGMNQVGK